MSESRSKWISGIDTRMRAGLTEILEKEQLPLDSVGFGKDRINLGWNRAIQKFQNTITGHVTLEEIATADTETIEAAVKAALSIAEDRSGLSYLGLPLTARGYNQARNEMRKAIRWNVRD